MYLCCMCIYCSPVESKQALSDAQGGSCTHHEDCEPDVRQRGPDRPAADVPLAAEAGCVHAATDAETRQDKGSGCGKGKHNLSH